jgi:phosphopentomutase
VPVLSFGPAAQAAAPGRRASFADVGATLAAHLALVPPTHGECFAHGH